MPKQLRWLLLWRHRSIQRADLLSQLKVEQLVDRPGRLLWHRASVFLDCSLETVVTPRIQMQTQELERGTKSERALYSTPAIKSICAFCRGCTIEQVRSRLGLAKIRRAFFYQNNQRDRRNAARVFETYLTSQCHIFSESEPSFKSAWSVHFFKIKILLTAHIFLAFWWFWIKFIRKSNCPHPKNLGVSNFTINYFWTSLEGY